jgi:hypothetical protein
MGTVALRDLLKRSSLLVNVVRSARVFRNKWTSGFRTNYEIANELAAFSPNSSGSTFRARAGLTLQSAQQTFPLIGSLVKLFPTEARSSGTSELAALFNQYGSDKSSSHDYHLVYAPLLGPRRGDPLRLLEIGHGTNNPDVVANMGRPESRGPHYGRFAISVQMRGCLARTFDRRVLFNEDRIQTYYVDQIKASSFDELYANLVDGMFDLVIDDGPHSPNANIATMLFALKILRPHGFFIVEDIRSDSISIWQVVAALLPENYSPKVVQAKSGRLFMIASICPTRRRFAHEKIGCL